MALFIHWGHAEEAWEPLGKADSGAEYFIGKPQKSGDKGVIRVWLKSDASNARPKRKFETAMTQFTIQCSAGLIREDTSVTYDKVGNMLTNYSAGPAAKFNPLVPESVGESVARSACLTTGFGDWMSEQQK